MFSSVQKLSCILYGTLKSINVYVLAIQRPGREVEMCFGSSQSLLSVDWWWTELTKV